MPCFARMRCCLHCSEANQRWHSETFSQIKTTAYNLRTKSAKSTGSERIGRRRAISGLFLPWPVNRSTRKTPGTLPKSGRIGRAERADHFETGGGGGRGYENSPTCCLKGVGPVPKGRGFETSGFSPTFPVSPAQGGRRIWGSSLLSLGLR